ncbi:MAG: hypothetical protein Q8K82_05600 [Gemmatimonadaceae bacterium]|nr:hypothetical protein [Gemmatimonadaceae bacterium]
MRSKRWDREAHVSGKRHDSRNLDGPQAKSVVAEVLLNAIGQRIALRASEHALKVLHHAWIGIHGSERLPVSSSPLPETKSGRQCFTGRSHFHARHGAE